MIFPVIKDNRYKRAIRQSINKRLGNTNTENRQLAGIIVNFSHKTELTDGDYLMNRDTNFFVVERVLSNHFALGFFAPSNLRLYGRYFYYRPSIHQKAKSSVKKIFSPFLNPHVKVRSKRYYLQRDSSLPRAFNSFPDYHTILNYAFI